MIKRMPRFVFVLAIALASSLTFAAKRFEADIAANEKILALPCPGPVKIDASLNDWDLVRRQSSCAAM